MASAQDDYAAIQSADTNVQTAQANVTAAQAALQSAQAALTTAQAADAQADQQLAADLAAGPGFYQNADGTVTVLTASASDPRGFTVDVVKPLSALPSVSPAPATPTPAPAPSAPAAS